MSYHTPESQGTQLESSPSDAVNQSRRKLTGAAALGVSAILTLASRPVLANNCLTPSAAASGNMSHHGTPPSCTGKAASAWAGTDPSRYPGDNVTFQSVFRNGLKSNRDDKKLKRVLNEGNNGNTGDRPQPISKEFAAALLNIRGGHIPASILTEVQLVGMWNEWVVDGNFNPKAGANWGANHIVTYLQGLQA